MEILTWAKGVWAAIKGVGDAGRAVEVAELEDRLDDERTRRRKMEDRVRQLEERLQTKGELESDGSIYWRLDGEGNRDRPTCARCWDAEEVPVTLIDTGIGVFRCPNCENNFPHDAASNTRRRRTRGVVDPGIDER